MLTKIKEILRLLIPPLFWSFLRQLKANLVTGLTPGFQGPYSSWEKAKALSNGWDSPEITEKTFQAAIKVRDGLVEFEQDTIVRNKIVYSETILAFLLLNLSLHKDHINIIDFGGSLATNYFQHRKILSGMSLAGIKWRIIERPILTNLGREHFANEQLTFFSNIEDTYQNRDYASDSYLFSGLLQYLPNPFDLLDQVIQVGGAKVLAFDRLLVSPTDEHSVYLQVPASDCYSATYPVWCFSRNLFIEYLVSKGFTLVEHFTSDPDRFFDHAGMLFKRISYTE